MYKIRAILNFRSLLCNLPLFRFMTLPSCMDSHLPTSPTTCYIIHSIFFLRNISSNQCLNYIVLLYFAYLQISRWSEINNYFIIKKNSSIFNFNIYKAWVYELDNKKYPINMKLMRWDLSYTQCNFLHYNHTISLPPFYIVSN